MVKYLLFIPSQDYFLSLSVMRGKNKINCSLKVKAHLIKLFFFLIIFWIQLFLMCTHNKLNYMIPLG